MSKRDSQKNQLIASPEHILLEKVRVHRDRLENEAETMTHALDLSPETTYDVLAVLYEQNLESLQSAPQITQEAEQKKRGKIESEINVVFHCSSRFCDIPSNDPIMAEQAVEELASLTLIALFERVVIHAVSVTFSDANEQVVLSIHAQGQEPLFEVDLAHLDRTIEERLSRALSELFGMLHVGRPDEEQAPSFRDPEKTKLAEESEWIRLASQGDSGALEKLYERYVNSIYRYIWRRVRNTDDAEALTSEIFTHAIEALMRGQSEWQGKPFGAWLFAIASHTYQGWARKKQPNIIPLENLSDYQPFIEKDGDALDKLLTDAGQVTLWQLMRKLSPTEQRILTSRYIYDLSYIEIAKRLHLTESACKQRHYRALQKLKLKVQRPELGQTVSKD